MSDEDTKPRGPLVGAKPWQDVRVDTSQPAPTPNELPAVWDLVIADMQARDRIGEERYGTRLQPHNGRDSLQDAYEEALDLAVYLRQRIEERSAPANWQDMVREFHEATGNPVAASPTEIPVERRQLRRSLIEEEAEELFAAMGFVDLVHLQPAEPSDLVAVADALADLAYVVVGTGVEYGIDLTPIFDAVHAANMTKQGGPVRADGKTLKPEGWEPPDIAGLIAEQMGFTSRLCEYCDEESVEEVDGVPCCHAHGGDC